MSIESENYWEFLGEREGVFAEEIIEQLDGVGWAEPLLSRIREAGGVTRRNMGLLFELRFAFALHRAGLEASYEVAGEGASTLDFGFAHQGRGWLVELMRLEETQASQNATHTATDEDGVRWFSRVFHSDAEDRRQTEEGETLKAVERICQKCAQGDGLPTKFPAPQDSFHTLLVDFRSFLHGGDNHDRVHVALGGEAVSHTMCRRFWGDQLISGVFSARTNVRGAEHARSRVHFLGFVDEREFEEDRFVEATRFIANPHLFESPDQARAAMATWPLQPAILLWARGGDAGGA